MGRFFLPFVSWLSFFCILRSFHPMRKRLYSLLSGVLLSFALFAQNSNDDASKTDKGEFSGNFQTNNQFYFRDDKIGANTTQYLHELSSTDAWLFMNYKFKGFSLSARYDIFNNTPLFNPQQAYSNQGIGFWQVSKEIEKVLTISAGYIYDQFGTGMVFRAYEDRNIGIDFAILGGRVIFHPTPNTTIKALTGKQKYRFDVREPIIKGVNAEHLIKINDDLSNEIGASIVNRTLDATTMNNVASVINSYPIEKRFDPKYNVYAYNVYNTLNYKKFTLYLEYAYKTNEAILDQSTTLVNRNGHIYYTSLSYSATGIGINAQFKRIETFPLRTNPLEIQPMPNSAVVNYLPSLTRQNTYRLLARYNAVVQELGENAAQLELTLKPNKKFQFNINTSVVTSLNGIKLSSGLPNIVWDSANRYFAEYYIDMNHKVTKMLKYTLGIQVIRYNQNLFEGKPLAPFVNAITPFGEITYKLNTRRSLRFEWQYMNTNQDLGSFVNGLLEYNVAPHWSFATGDLVNITPGFLNKPKVGEAFEYIHYYQFFSSYTYKTSRFTAAFIKQPQGVNCTGGVCRVEPAFSGFRVTLSTNF
jgi:hypothetical protein